MTTSRASSHPLGFTASKSSFSAARATGKRAAKLERGPEAFEPDADAPKRTYTPEELQRAEGRPALALDDPRYDALWERTKAVMGASPLHARGTNRIEHILRVFDLDPTFGPCMGLTRLERWHRAKDLGECPPEEICEILNTREGVLDLRLSILDY